MRYVIPAAQRWLADVARGALRAATSDRVMRGRVGSRFWLATLSAPGISDRVRVGLAGMVQESMIKSGRDSGIVPSALASMSRRLRDPVARVELQSRLALAELACGRVPVRLEEAVAAQLTAADECHLAGDERRAARCLVRAFSIAFHRVLHFDRLTSPLAADPEGYLAPFRASIAARALTAHHRTRPTATPPVGRPLRLLVATRDNANFLTEIVQRYRSAPGVEVRFLDLASDPVREPLTRRTDELIQYLLAGRSRFGRQVSEWLRPHLDWADTVFIDWCVATAALFTALDPGGTRVILRIHSFELFSHWPHVVNFGRVDDVVVVSDHMRDLARVVSPALRAGPRLHVIPNAADLGRFVRPKTAEARFTLGLVGVGSVVKDPRWTLEVLRLVREHDPRYRLVMIGNGLNPATSASVAEYDALLQPDLYELEAAGAVRRIGHTDDVAAALTHIGVIISSSVRESFHVALVEGAASGAVPVVRDWPFFAGRATGASTLFPREWVVATPAEAAKRIVDATSTESDWLVAGKHATDHALASWDWAVTRHHFDRLLLGRVLPTPTTPA